jgi:hypothetical protein
MVVEILENLVHVSVLGNKDWTTYSLVIQGSVLTGFTVFKI